MASRRSVSSELSSSFQYTNYNDFNRSLSVTSPPPRRNGALSPTAGISQGGRKTPTVLIEERSRSIIMANEGEQMYFPPGYTKCDLKASRLKTPSFKVTNERAWANPTPTPWGRNRINLEFNRPSADFEMPSSSIVGKFRSFYSTIEQVKAAFAQYDVNRDGNISRQELEDGMVQSGQFSFDEARAAFDIADINGDGEIDIAEFVQVMFPTAAEIVSNLRKNFNSMEDVERVFKAWDLNGDGAISFTELQSAVSKSGPRMSEEEMNAIFVIGDVDQNGEIDLEEFKRLMLPTTSDVVTKFRSVHKTVKDVQAAFKRFDLNGDGSIDRSELSQALTSSGQSYTQQEINVIFNAADVNKDGTVDFEEFIGLMCPSAADIVAKFRSQYKNIEDVKAAFKRFDKNGDGALSHDELAAALKSSGQSYANNEVDAIFSLGDLDGDGEITLAEFVSLMSPSATETLNKIRANFRSIQDVKAAFKSIDTNNDGLLSKQEMMSSRGYKFDGEEIDAIFELGDVNGDGEIDMGEFIGVMYPSASEIISRLSSSFGNMDEVRASFRQLDKDGDGSIDRNEMASSSHKFSAEQIDALFALGDVNDDGAIDLDEYLAVMCPSAELVISHMRQKFNNINDVKKAFMKIDINKDGMISRSEMAGKFNGQEVDAIFMLGDINGDGDIDLEEFIGLMCPSASQALAKLSKTVKNIAEAQQLFRMLDKNGDGQISMEEMRSCGQKLNAKEIDAIFAIGDINNDGEIDINEFLNVMCPAATTVIARIRSQFPSPLDIEACFNEIDIDHDGKITKCELTQFSTFNEQEINAVFDLGDADRDGQIDLNEFITVMTTSSPVPYTEAGETVKVGDLEIYKVGGGAKCVIWCHDLAGFSGVDRIRQLADKMATSGYLVVIPNFLPNQEGGSLYDQEYIKSVSDWNKLRDVWVETLYPWIRDEMGAKSIGVVGVGWGAYLATRLSSYGEVNAGAIVNPSTSVVVEFMQEDLYELYEEVSSPQLYTTARDDCPNEKHDGLAYKIFKSCKFGQQCEFHDLPDVFNGYLLEGDRSVECIAIQAKRTLNNIIAFFKPLLRYPGEVIIEESDLPKAKKFAEVDLDYHSSNTCRMCLEVSHQAHKSELKSAIRSS